MSESGFAQITGARLAWWADGEDVKDADPLVLVHAGVADARMWEPIVPALAATRRVIRFALKGMAGRKLRTALTAIAIVLGVAMITGTYILTDSINRAFAGIFKAQTGASEGDAQAWLTGLVSADRYLEDIWPSGN